MNVVIPNVHLYFFMDSNHLPQPISPAEWDEIVALPYVRESWGLDDQTGMDFSSVTYGAKFDFMNGGPGYCGNLYVIHGDYLGGPPVVLCRDRDQKLKVVSYEESHPVEEDR